LDTGLTYLFTELMAHCHRKGRMTGSKTVP